MVVGTNVVGDTDGWIVEGTTDVDDEVEVVAIVVVVSLPPNESVKINPTISMTTKALAPMMTS
jgi:hypothetical protein